MPVTPPPLWALYWPVYAESEVAGLCRSVTTAEQLLANFKRMTTTRDDVKLAASNTIYGDRITVFQESSQDFILERRKYDAAGNLLESGVDDYPNNGALVPGLTNQH